MLGNQLQFTAAVKNSSDATVTWSVNEVTGGAAQMGTITRGGLYTAPGDLPIPANLTVPAISHADVTKSGTAIVTGGATFLSRCPPAVARARSASYTAPLASPTPNVIVVTITPLADPSEAAQQQFSIQGGSAGVGVTVTPTTATRAINHHIT